MASKSKFGGQDLRSGSEPGAGARQARVLEEPGIKPISLEVQYNQDVLNACNSEHH